MAYNGGVRQHFFNRLRRTSPVRGAHGGVRTQELAIAGWPTNSCVSAQACQGQCAKADVASHSKVNYASKLKGKSAMAHC